MQQQSVFVKAVVILKTHADFKCLGADLVTCIISNSFLLTDNIFYLPIIKYDHKLYLFLKIIPLPMTAQMLIFVLVFNYENTEKERYGISKNLL